jgi:hypothetical protein
MGVSGMKQARKGERALRRDARVASVTREQRLNESGSLKA